MARKDNGNEEEEVKVEQRPYTNEAALRLVNLLYDPDEEHLLSLTRLNSSREALLLSIQIAKEAALDPTRTILLSTVWRRAFLTLRRSIDMKAFMLGIGLASEQTESEAEVAAEEADL